MSESSSQRFPEEFADRHATAQDHLEASDSLRISAQQAINAGDIVLASEAYWGVAAHALQAVAERNGIRHSTNLDFRRIIDWLVLQTRNDELPVWFQRSYDLHQNYYRVVMSQQEVHDLSHYALRLADQIRDYA